MQTILPLLQASLASGQTLGLQLYISHRGRILADLALGLATPNVSMTTDTAMLWLSAGKPLTAVCVCQLGERGRLGLHDPVARHIPEFAAHGKTDTIFHLLTHTSSVRAGIMPRTHDRGRIIEAICQMRPEPRWTPGQRAGYSAFNNWDLLGEVIHRVDGRQPEQYLVDEILAPLGLDRTTMALTPDQYPAWQPGLGLMMRTDVAPPLPYESHAEHHVIYPRPGSSLHGPARQLGGFYDMLLAGGVGPSGVRILAEATVRAMTTRQRAGLMDETFGRRVDMGLGVLINTPMPGDPPFAYGFGPLASPDTFGHAGYQSSLGLCDVGRELVVAIVFNGLPGEAAHAGRIYGLLRAIYEALPV